MAATKRIEQKAATRARLLAAATALFASGGYEAANIRAIADAAGLSTGAFFNHWKGKAEVYREIYGHDPITPERARALLLAARAVRDGDGGALNWLTAAIALAEGDETPQAKAA